MIQQSGPALRAWAPHHTHPLQSPFLPLSRRYTALLYRSGSTASPLFNLTLAANGTSASGTTSFAEELALPAGPYQLEIVTANVHGAGGKTPLSAEFSVGEIGGRLAADCFVCICV